MVFRRNNVGWIAACAWRNVAKDDDLVALKRAKREIDQRLIEEAGELLGALVRQLRGEAAADAITCIPCGHSRRPDCFGKRLAQRVADVLGLPFLQVFADRFCSGQQENHQCRSTRPRQTLQAGLWSLRRPPHSSRGLRPKRGLSSAGAGRDSQCQIFERLP
jgi:hypothetical protein